MGWMNSETKIIAVLTRKWGALILSPDNQEHLTENVYSLVIISRTRKEKYFVMLLIFNEKDVFQAR